MTLEQVLHAAHEAAAAATKHREQVEKEEQEGSSVEYDGIRYRYNFATDRFERFIGGTWYFVQVADYFRALASLLPRKPVEVTEQLTRNALDVFWSGRPYGNNDVVHMRAALEAVASDLSAPVAVSAPTLGEPHHWRIVDRRGNWWAYDTEAFAKRRAAEWNKDCPDEGPFVVYVLHRVPDETEGAANG